MKIIKKKIVSGGFFKKIEYKKIIPVEAKEDTDEYFVRYKIRDQQPTKIIPKFIDKEKSIPTKTAIPFPPWNFNHTGNICPRKHNKADK